MTSAGAAAGTCASLLGSRSRLTLHFIVGGKEHLFFGLEASALVSDTFCWDLALLMTGWIHLIWRMFEMIEWHFLPLVMGVQILHLKMLIHLIYVFLDLDFISHIKWIEVGYTALASLVGFMGFVQLITSQCKSLSFSLRLNTVG